MNQPSPYLPGKSVFIHWPILVRPAVCLLLLSLCLISACQVRPPAPAAFPDDPAKLRQWRLDGRMGYSNGQQSGHAGLRWQHQQHSGEIRFSGPLGSGSAHLIWEPSGARLETGRETIVSDSLDELAWRLTGLWLPVEALSYWVRGLAWPDSAPVNTSRDSDGNLSELEQLGWKLSFDRYRSVDGLLLPHRVRARQGDNRLSLVIQQWHAQP